MARRPNEPLGEPPRHQRDRQDYEVDNADERGGLNSSPTTCGKMSSRSKHIWHIAAAPGGDSTAMADDRDRGVAPSCSF